MELSKPITVQYYGFMTLTSDFWGKILKKVLSEKADVECKGCEFIGSGTHFVTEFDLIHDLDLGCWRSNFEKAVSQELDVQLT